MFGDALYFSLVMVRLLATSRRVWETSNYWTIVLAKRPSGHDGGGPSGHGTWHWDPYVSQMECAVGVVARSLANTLLMGVYSCC
jgi:hypothetical protein